MNSSTLPAATSARTGALTTLFKTVFAVLFPLLGFLHYFLCIEEWNMTSVIQRILGHAKIDYHHAPGGTIKLRLRSPLKSQSDTASGPTNVQEVPLSTLVESITPSCTLNPLLFNGHLQTIYTAVKKDDLPIYYKRKVFVSDSNTYPGSFAADFVAKPYDTAGRPGSGKVDGHYELPPRTTYFTEEEWSGMEAGSLDRKPMLVVLHGLSGGSHEVYLRHVIAPLVPKAKVGSEAEGALEWEAVVINSRGCARSKITSSMLFNARSTWDLRQAMMWLRKKFPNRPLFGVGFSLGANILTNYLGEEGTECQFKAALIVSNPWNLDASAVQLKSSWIGKHLYLYAMGKNVKTVALKHSKELSTNTMIDLEAVRKAKYLFEFDRAVQCASWGYPTEGAYYRDASSIDSVMAIRIPFLAIHALDDPIANGESLPFQEVKQTPYGVMLTTSIGGHLSWTELDGKRWFPKVTTNFLEKLANELDMEKPFDPADVPIGPSKRPGLSANFEPMRRKMHGGPEAGPGAHRP